MRLKEADSSIATPIQNQALLSWGSVSDHCPTSAHSGPRTLPFHALADVLIDLTGFSRIPHKPTPRPHCPTSQSGCQLDRELSGPWTGGDNARMAMMTRRRRPQFPLLTCLLLHVPPVTSSSPFPVNALRAGPAAGGVRAALSVAEDATQEICVPRC